jgi:aminoglycoside phosphotransferase (APT) family kinase protein
LQLLHYECYNSVNGVGAASSNASAGETAVPSSEAFLAAVRKCLEAEFGQSIGKLSVKDAETRRYSSTWKIEIDNDRRQFLLKWLPHRAARELELTLLTRKLFMGEPLFQVPGFACAPTPDTFLVEWMSGEPLNSCCTRPPFGPFGSWLERQKRVLRNTGIWLNRFHASSRDVKSFPLDGFKRYIANREKVLPAIDPALAAQLFRSVEAHTAASTVRVHGDFSPHNILVNGDVLGVIDFAGINEFDRGSPWFDVATMYLGVEEYWHNRLRNYLRFMRAPLQQLQAAFLDGYGVKSKEDPVFRLACALRHFSKLYSHHQRKGPGGKAWDRHLQGLRRELPAI